MPNMGSVNPSSILLKPIALLVTTHQYLPGVQSLSTTHMPGSGDTPVDLSWILHTVCAASNVCSSVMDDKNAVVIVLRTAQHVLAQRDVCALLCTSTTAAAAVGEALEGQLDLQCCFKCIEHAEICSV